MKELLEPQKQRREQVRSVLASPQWTRRVYSEKEGRGAREEETAAFNTGKHVSRHCTILPFVFAGYKQRAQIMLLQPRARCHDVTE